MLIKFAFTVLPVARASQWTRSRSGVPPGYQALQPEIKGKVGPSIGMGCEGVVPVTTRLAITPLPWVSKPMFVNYLSS